MLCCRDRNVRLTASTRAAGSSRELYFACVFGFAKATLGGLVANRLVTASEDIEFGVGEMLDVDHLVSVPI